MFPMERVDENTILILFQKVERKSSKALTQTDCGKKEGTAPWLTVPSYLIDDEKHTPRYIAIDFSAASWGSVVPFSLSRMFVQAVLNFYSVFSRMICQRRQLPRLLRNCFGSGIAICYTPSPKLSPASFASATL